jgi:hypothetical protein
MDDKKHDLDGDDESSPKWAEMIKRVMSVGLGAAFMTEESIRNTLGDIKLPKEVLTTILQGASRSKEDFLNKIGNETIKLISKIDFVKEASRFVEEHKFHISADIEVVKKDPHRRDEPGLALKTQVKIKD